MVAVLWYWLEGAVPGYWLVVAVPWYWLVCRGEFSDQLVGRVCREVDKLVRDWFVVRREGDGFSRPGEGPGEAWRGPGEAWRGGCL